MKWLKDNAETIVAILVMVGMIVGGLSYFATSEELILVDMRLEQKIVGDGIFNLTMQMTQLENKYNNTPCSTWNDYRDQQQYQRLKLQVEALKKKQDVIIQRQTKGKQ